MVIINLFLFDRYGDFVPRRFISRVFTVIWILIGLITTALLIGAITATLTSLNEAANNIKIYGSQVKLIKQMISDLL